MINELVGFDLVSPEIGTAAYHMSLGAFFSQKVVWKWVIRIAILTYGINKLISVAAETWTTKGKNLVIPSISVVIVASLAGIASMMLTGCSRNVSGHLSPTNETVGNVNVYDHDRKIDIGSNAQIEVASMLTVDDDGMFIKSNDVPIAAQIEDDSDEVSFSKDVTIGGKIFLSQYVDEVDVDLCTPKHINNGVRCVDGFTNKSNGGSNSRRTDDNRVLRVKKQKLPVVVEKQFKVVIPDTNLPRVGKVICVEETATYKALRIETCNALYPKNVTDEQSRYVKAKHFLRGDTRSACLKSKTKRILGIVDEKYRGTVLSVELHSTLFRASQRYTSCIRKKKGSMFTLVNPFSIIRQVKVTDSEMNK